MIWFRVWGLFGVQGVGYIITSKGRSSEYEHSWFARFLRFGAQG